MRMWGVISGVVLLAWSLGCTSGSSACGVSKNTRLVQIGVVGSPNPVWMGEDPLGRYVSAGGTRTFETKWNRTLMESEGLLLQANGCSYFQFEPGALKPTGITEVWTAKVGQFVDNRYQAPADPGLDTLTVRLSNGWEMFQTLEVVPAPEILTFESDLQGVAPGQSVTVTCAWSARAEAVLREGTTWLASRRDGGSRMTFTFQPKASTTLDLEVTNRAGDRTRKSLDIGVR